MFSDYFDTTEAEQELQHKSSPKRIRKVKKSAKQITKVMPLSDDSEHEEELTVHG